MNALWLPDWSEISREETGPATKILAEYGVLPEACPKCGVVGRLYRHGEKVVEYRDAPAFGRRLTLAVKVKRLRCMDCGATSMQPLPDMHPVRQITRRCADHLIEQCRTRNYAEMSRETGVDESVIRSLCNEAYETVKAARRPIAPIVLGIDELTLHRRRRCILVDIQTGETLDLLPGISKSQVVHWLSHMQAKERCKVVTMDMWKNYRSAVHGVLPNAAVVIDKWHIQKMANDALDKVRARHRRGQTTKAGKKNPWRVKRILMARRHNLKPRAELLLDGLLKNNALVADAYTTKEAFYDIWEAADRKAAESAFDAWEAAIPASVSAEFGAVAKTVANWRKEIFAYFDHRYTNALTEAVNGLVKAINRDGRGYLFPHIRAKILGVSNPAEPRTERCESCFAAIAASEVQEWRGMKVCATCRRLVYTQAEFEAHRHSTLKNG